MSTSLSTYRESTGKRPSSAEPFKYPGGELSIKNLPERSNERVVYIATVHGAELDDLMTAALWADVAHQRGQRFVLNVPYLPAARADRGEPCGKYVYAKLINAIGADHIITIDQHSTLGEHSYRGRFTDLPLWPLLERALEGRGHWRYDGIIAPDKGAKGRADEVARHLGLPLIVGDKTRDFATGKITDYKLPGLSKHGRYLVVDDICDGGWTFTLLADKSGLHKEQIDLWVTHGIFSGAASNLRNYYGHILTSDSHPGHNRVGVATTIVPTYTYLFETMLKGLEA